MDGGWLPPQGSQARYDLSMTLLKGGMSGAAQSTSPLLQFLAPIAGAVIGSKAEAARGDYLDQTDDNLLEAMGGVPAGAQPYFDAMRNPEASDAVRALAKTKFDAAMKPPKTGGGSGGGGRRRASGGSSGGQRLSGEELGADGILYGRTRDGRMVPYTGPDGQPFMPKGNPAAVAATTDPLGILAPAAPATPSADDPLGLRS
jgi:hypothetical protein